jgi:hypothetical protein
MAPMRSLTLVKVPRRIAWRVMMPKKISTMFSQELEVGGEVQRDATRRGPETAVSTGQRVSST